MMPEPSPTRAVMVVLAYLWPLALVPLLVERNEPDVQWHARNGLLLMVAEIVLLTIFVVITSVMNLATFSVLAVVLWIAILTVHFVAIIRGINGERLIIRGVSTYANRS